MILTIDIGNTNITLGAYKGDELLFVSRLATERSRTEDQYAIELSDIFVLNNIVPSDFKGAIISSVVPELTSVIKHAVKKITAKTSLVIGPGVKTGLNIAIDNPAQLGADFVAGGVAAINMYPLPCLIMDLGTATKISVINKDGAFLGCTITAGIGISLEALAAKTSQLPRISFEPPPHTIGTNTVDSMGAGVIFGTAAMLDGMAHRIEEELGQSVKTIVATGGLSHTIVPNCKRKIILNNNLILDGLKIIYCKNTERS